MIPTKEDSPAEGDPKFDKLFFLRVRKALHSRNALLSMLMKSQSQSA